MSSTILGEQLMIQEMDQSQQHMQQQKQQQMQMQQQQQASASSTTSSTMTKVGQVWNFDIFDRERMKVFGCSYYYIQRYSDQGRCVKLAVIDCKFFSTSPRNSYFIVCYHDVEYLSSFYMSDRKQINRGCPIIIWTGLNIKIGIVQKYMSDQAGILAQSK